jgi:uncharacterized protein YprB with RNaseH-like and TPR domain
MGLREQLEALGMRRGVEHLPAPAERPRRAGGIEDLIAGEVVATPQGDCFVVQQTFPPAHQQGAAPLAELWQQRPLAFSRLAGDARFLEIQPAQIVFLDIETTGLSGGAGTYAFLVGVGYFQADQSFIVRQYFLRDYGEEPAQMHLLAEALEPFRAVASFNGKAFDLPIVTTRLTLNHLANPLCGAPHLDLLAPARRLWQGWLPSCALSALEVHVLGVRRGSEDVPGYIIPSLYFDYLRTGDALPLVNVFWHNQQDILSMVTLTTRLCQMLDAPLERSLTAPEMLGVARFYEELGEPAECERIYRAALAGAMPAHGTRQASRRLAALYKRGGRRSEAAVLWADLLNDADADAPLDAYVELAKHYEWTDHDIPHAAEITERAIGWVRRWQRGPERQRNLTELEHRLLRLQRKADGKLAAGDDQADA